MGFKMDRKTFSEEMVKIQMAFGDVKEEKFKFYFELLREQISNEQMIKATKNLCAEFVPTAANQFPAPAHIISAAGLSSVNSAQDYITMVRHTARKVGGWKSIDFGSPALHSVIERWGGWEAISAWGQDEWDINEGRFKTVLEMALKNGDIGPDHVRGTHEKENGYLEEKHLVKIQKHGGKILSITENDKSLIKT